MDNGGDISKLAGIVVVYEPDEYLVSRIQSYLGYLYKLFIVDNSRLENSGIKSIFNNNPKVEYIFNGNNIGMAAALNLGAGLAFEENCSWLLTMDQDSSFSEKSILDYMTAFKQLSDSPEIAAIGVNHEAGNNPRNSESMQLVNALITSGSLVKLSAWQQIGGFNEKLFIDEVDHEYCYRLIGRGFKVVKLNDIILNHQMGHQKRAGYFGLIMKRERMIHSPLRVYYIVRNYLYVRKDFKSQLPAEFKYRDRQVKTIVKNNLFFSGKFLNTLQMAIRGFQDYRKGVTGKFINH